MNTEHQDAQDGLREIARELQRFRRAVLAGFAAICLIAGLLMLCYPDYRAPMAVCFAATAGFTFWAAPTRHLKRLSQEVHEEVRRQRSPGHALSKGQDDAPAV
jgi:hypothetical protein